MDAFDAVVCGRLAGVGNGFEVGEESSAPGGCFAFGLHRVEERVSGEIIDTEEEVCVSSDGGPEWSGDVAEDAFTGAVCGAVPGGGVWQVAGSGELAALACADLAFDEGGGKAFGCAWGGGKLDAFCASV